MLTTALTAALMSAPKSTEITVYNQGMALVKQVRDASLKRGRQEVVVEDVAQMIDPTSVGFRCISSPGSIQILEQNYQYDLISPAAILNKSVGKRIRLTRTIGNQRDVVEGVLMNAPQSVVNTGNGTSYNYSGLVLKTDDGRIILSPQGEIEVTQIPEGLISVPSLLWDLQSEREQNATIELSYITQGMRWTSDYVLTLTSDNTADIQGWVTMVNNSGMSFKDTKLKLLAGEVNIADRGPKLGGGRAEAAMMKASNDGFKEESLFEYHLYTLQRPASVRNNETKQLSLLEGTGVPVKKQIIFDSMMGFDGYYPNEGEVGTGSLSPLVKLKFINDEKSDLGMPLPAGKFRIYQRDASGSVQLLGEDTINHTPRNEKVTLDVGRSFDIRADRKRTSFRRISDRSFRESFEIEVRNRKKAAETVYVYERHWGDWRYTEKSMDFVKEDANTAVFELKLAADEVKTIKYTVETRW
jgi:hypothetical protein